MGGYIHAFVKRFRVLAYQSAFSKCSITSFSIVSREIIVHVCHLGWAKRAPGQYSALSNGDVSSLSSKSRNNQVLRRRMHSLLYKNKTIK